MNAILLNPAEAKQFSFQVMMIDAADQGDIATVKHTAGSGQNVNIRGAFGVTALMRAAYKGNKEIVQYLLKMGADPDIQDIGGATALHLAAREGHHEVLKLLLNKSVFGELPDIEGYTPSMRAVLSEKPKALEVLIAHGIDPNKVTEDGQSIFSLASHSSNPKIRELVKKIEPQPSLKQEIIIEERKITPGIGKEIRVTKQEIAPVPQEVMITATPAVNQVDNLSDEEPEVVIIEEMDDQISPSQNLASPDVNLTEQVHDKGAKEQIIEVSSKEDSEAITEEPRNLRDWFRARRAAALRQEQKLAEEAKLNTAAVLQKQEATSAPKTATVTTVLPINKANNISYAKPKPLTEEPRNLRDWFKARRAEALEKQRKIEEIDASFDGAINQKSSNPVTKKKARKFKVTEAVRVKD